MIEISGLMAQMSGSPSIWLTPLWILSVGVLAGTVVVALMFSALWGISRVPVLGEIYDNRPLRFRVGLGLGGVVLAFAIWRVAFPQFAAWNEASGQGVALRNGLLLALILIPASLGLGFGLLALISRRAMDDVLGALQEGALFWLSCLAGTISLYAVLGYCLAMLGGISTFEIVRAPDEKLYSLVRLNETKIRDETVHEIPADNGVGTEIEINFLSVELALMEFQSDQRLEIAAEEIVNDIDTAKIIAVDDNAADNDWSTFFPVTSVGGPIPDGEVTKLWVRNLGDAPAKLTLRLTTQPEYPEVAIIPRIAAALVLVFLFYMIQRTALPKVSAIALSTFKTEVAQPIYLLFIMLGSLFAVASIYIPYYTLGEDIKMLKDSVLTVILVFSIFMAVWAASKSIAEEIEGRTALTVLSKPIGRRDFILGKFLGITWSTGLLYLVMGIIFLAVVSYKPVYDAKETSQADVYWQQCFIEMVSMIPALTLAFMEAIVFVAISVAISTRLPIMANLMICFAIYVLGHLTPLIVQSSVAIQAFEPVVFFGQLVATIVPVLDHFNVQAALTGGASVPAAYLGWSFLYCSIYAAIAMLLALVFFEDRDLA